MCYGTNQHMQEAVGDVSAFSDEERRTLMTYFRHMAYFLVAGKTFTNDTHLIGYHNKMSASGGDRASGGGGELQASGARALE